MAHNREPEETPGALAAYGFRPEFRTLSICTTCWDLFDGPSPGHGDFEQQKCRCHRQEEHRWPGYDYNERARLCDCCGRYVLRSGSRWSVWFCEACKERVRLLNQEFGFALIPIGRHSLMHGFGLQGEPDEAQIARFVERFGDLARRMDVLHNDWKPEHLREELERLGLIAKGEASPQEIPLATYLGAVAEEDRTSTVDHRLLAFRALADRFEVREILSPEGKPRAEWTTPAESEGSR